METASREDLPEISQLVELISDAIVICGADGVIGHANRRMLGLLGGNVASLAGTDI